MTEWLENPALCGETPCFILATDHDDLPKFLEVATQHPTHVLCLSGTGMHSMGAIRAWIASMIRHQITMPVILGAVTDEASIDAQLIHLATETGGLLLDGLGDGVWLRNQADKVHNIRISGRTYLAVKDNRQLLYNTAFCILQATRTRISKTEYISCPSCGRTLFDLQETTAKIRAATHHLKGVKIAIMGCIVN